MLEHRLAERPLEGLVILIVQRRWLLARQVSAALNEKGARSLLANCPDQSLADAPDLSAAVLDGDSPGLCRMLEARGVPYVLYTGYEPVGDACANTTVVRKPASAEEIVAAVEQLLRPAAF